MPWNIKVFDKLAAPRVTVQAALASWGTRATRGHDHRDPARRAGQAQGPLRLEHPAPFSAEALRPSYLAGFQDLEHQGQALGNELLCVFFLLDGLKLL